jgi:hypothetical protein
MVHNNAAEYTHTFAHSKWRILIQDDHNDMVITWQHYHEVKGILKWVGMGHLDQSCHNSYHAHMFEEDKRPIDIAPNLSDSEKLKQGMKFLKSKAQEQMIKYGDDYLKPEDVHMELVPQLLKKIAANGTRANSVSINATAAIVTANTNTPFANASE